jgi:[protein-PII] uridylyltransferase
MIEIASQPWSERVHQLLAARNELLADLGRESGGIAWCADHTQIVDSVVAILSDEIRAAYPGAPRLAIIATGGYGRRELAPYSDIDLTVVPQEEDSPHLDEALRSLFRALHQSLGSLFKFEIGYAYRLIADVPGLDPKTRTGLLDARLVAGSQAVYAELMEAFWQALPSGEFILSKISERDEAMAKTNDTPLVVEPHLKEGAGGLRAFQTANWIRAAIGERAIRPGHAYDTLLGVRNLLHKVSGRRQDLLSRQRQAGIAEAAGWPHAEMMGAVSESLIEGEEAYRGTLERVREARFSLSDAVTALRGEARVLSPADPGLAAVGVAIASQLGLEVSRLPAAYQDHLSGEAALFAFTTGEKTLRNLDRCGVLDVLLPELTACRTLLPDDSSHTYSVFEHTIRVVRRLDTAGSEPFFRDLRDSVIDLEPLYLAALLHDAGKLETARSGVDHSVAGEAIVREVGRRWSLPPDVVDLAAWLVREHLTLAHTMRIRDLQDPATISEFAAVVQTSQRLHLLALLTWADISSVAEGTFTPAQGAFLRELVTRTQEFLDGQLPTVAEPGAMRSRLQRELAKRDVSEEEVEAFLDSLPAQYLASTAPDLVRLHMAYVAKAREGEVTVESLQRHDLHASEITLCAPDTPGLLGQALGALYAFDLSVSAIRASTTESTPPIALDVFTVSFGNRPVPNGTWRQLSSAMREVLARRSTVEDLMRARGKNPERRQEVFSYRLLDGPPAILEIQAPRGRGMAFRLSRLLTAAGLEIVSARVGQWAGAAAAAFYLKPSPSLREAVENALEPHLRAR